MKTTQEILREKIAEHRRIDREIAHLCMSVSDCKDCGACDGSRLERKKADDTAQKEFQKHLAQQAK